MRYRLPSNYYPSENRIGQVHTSIMAYEVNVFPRTLKFFLKLHTRCKMIVSRTCFIFRSPQPKNIRINEILGPFQIEVWYLMGGFFLLSVFTMSLAYQYDNDEKSTMHYSNSLLTVVGAICQQSSKNYDL